MARQTKHRPSASRTERRRAATQRRRRLAFERTNQAQRQLRRRRRRHRATALAAAVAAVAAVTTFVLTRKPAQPSRSLKAALVTATTDALLVDAAPARYHAVYRVQSYDAGKATTSTEDLTVQRPFDGHVVIREGPPPGVVAQFEGRSNFGLYANSNSSGGTDVAMETPTVAIGDTRLDATLDDLVAAGALVRKERRRATIPAHGTVPAEQRDCQVYRAGAPIESLRVAVPTPTDHADACVDESGLLLEEVVVTAGKVAEHLTATQIVPDTDPAPDAFTIAGQPTGIDQGGSLLNPIDAGTPPAAGYWQPGTAPAGFQHRGRYLLLAPDKNATDASAPPRASYVDVWVADTRLVVIQQGPVAAAPDNSAITVPGETADAGALGSGQVLVGLVGNTLVAHPTPESFVQVTATLPTPALAKLASTLVRAG